MHSMHHVDTITLLTILLENNRSTQTPFIAGPIVAGIFFVFKFAVYWKMQFVSAGIVTGIPSKSSVVEVDAQDGKNIFYLPKGTDYTAVMSPGEAAPVTPKPFIVESWSSMTIKDNAM